MVLGSYVNLVLVFVPVGFVRHYIKLNPVAIFFTATTLLHNFAYSLG
jgi:Ca2+/H+ antiporter